VKSFVKPLAEILAGVVMAPCVTLCWLGQRVAGPRAFAGWSQAVSLLPGLSGEYLRRAFYRRVLAGCGPGSVISFGTLFSHPTAEVGARAYIGPFCVLGDVTVGDDCLIGSHVSIANGSRQHGIDRLDVPVREQPGVWPRITIGRDTWIGDRAVVLADVGAQCVVGAGAVVTRPVPNRAIVAGVPARIIGWRGGEPANLTEDVHNPAQTCGLG